MPGKQPFQISVKPDSMVSAIEVRSVDELSAALMALGLPRRRPVLVLIGGAGGMGVSDVERLRPLFVDVLVPTMINLGVTVVDGGTATGVMSLMGHARAAHRARFPLVGVASIGTVSLPSAPPSLPSTAPLEPNHSHFVFVPGDRWGDEAPWLARVATDLALNAGSVTVLVGGGAIAYEDVAESVAMNRPVLVLRGSGGAADALSHALFGAADDDRSGRLAASGLLHSLDLSQHGISLGDVLQQYLFEG